MPEDKWELLLPDNFATLESAGRSIEMLGDYVRGAGERRTTDGVHAQDGGQDGEQPVRRFRKHAGSLGVSEHAYDSGDSARPQAGAVQRRREKAVHSQFMMADGAVSVAGSRAGSMTGPNGLQAALAAQQRAFAGVRRSGEGGRRQGSFSGNGVRRSTDMVERSAGSLPHMQFQVASWHGKRVVAGRVPSGVSPGRSGMGGAIDSGHGPRGPTKSRQSRLGIAPDAGGSSRRHHTEPDAPTATARDSVDQAQPGTYARPAGMDMGVGAIPEGEGSIVEEDGERATRGGSMSARVRSRDKGSGQQETGETEAAPGRSAGQKVRWWRWRERSAAREG